MNLLTPENADLVTRVCFLSPGQGGRSSPPGVTGYRGQFFFDNADRDAIHIFEQAPVPFAKEITDHIIVINRDNLKFLRVGMIFLIREGVRTVGYGQIIRINTK